MLFSRPSTLLFVRLGRLQKASKFLFFRYPLAFPRARPFRLAHATMDRLARFRRRKSDLAAAASATSVAAEDKASESKAPAPAPPTQALVPPSRPREKHTLSPFRSLRLRTSIKRARESPPAALPLSPSAAVHQHHDDHRVYPRSPLSTRKDASQVNTAHAQQPKPKIPSFLTLSNQGRCYPVLLLRLSSRANMYCY